MSGAGHLKTPTASATKPLLRRCPLLPRRLKMAASLDMSLDDIIDNNRRNREPNNAPVVGRPRRPGSGAGGPVRRHFPRAPYRDAMPYLDRLPMPMVTPIWEQQMPAFTGDTAGRDSGIKLYVSNLDYGVTNDDLTLLFSSVGELERYSIHCDKSGRSKGTAEVVFIHEADAIAAIKRFNNVLLDGKPMMIEIVGKNLVTPAPPSLINQSILGRHPGFSARPPSISRGQWNSVPRPTWGNIRRGAMGRAQATTHPNKPSAKDQPSAKDLDADLERDHFEALKIK